MTAHAQVKRLVGYGLVGGVSTSIHVACAYLLIGLFGASLIVSNFVGFLSAYLFSYLAQSRLVFAQAISYRKAAKYFLVQVLSLSIALCLAPFINGYSIYWKTVVIALLLPLITYVIHSIWTFR